MATGMPARSLYIRVGLLIVLTIAMVIGVVLALTGNRLSDGHKYETYFRESVQGLDVGAPVKFRGVTLGRITNIGLVAAEYPASAEQHIGDPTYRLVVVRFKLDPKRMGRVPETKVAVQTGLRTHLASQGLTGVMYMELDFVPPGEHPVAALPWAPEDDYIPSIPSTIAQVQDTLTNIMVKLDAVNFGKLFANVDGLVSSLHAELDQGGDAHTAIADARGAIAALRTQVEQADLPGLSAQLKQTGASFQHLADGPQTRDTIKAARAALDKLPGLIAALQAASARADHGVADISAELLPILRDTRATMQNLRDASETIRRDPGQVLWQGAPPKGGK